MRRISVFVASIAISFVMALSGLAFSPAHASALADGNYLCSTGVITTTMGPTYTITDDVVSAGSLCGGDIVISAGVRSIEHHAFTGAGSITSVTFADDGMLTDIGVYAFEWVAGLTSIAIPASVTTIGAGAFFADSALASIFFLGNDPAIDGDIFMASQYTQFVSASPTKAYFRTGATGFASDIDGKWNGVLISPFYKLTFDGTDSESGSAPRQIFSGAGNNVTIPDNTGGLMRAGYNFAGWTDGDGNPYPAGLVGPMPAFDGTLLAAWTPSNSNVLVDGKYACGDGTYKITTVGSVTTFSNAGTCTGDLVIPEGVTATSMYAFTDVQSPQVTSISLPQSLNQIGFVSFYGTGSLTAFNVASTNVSITSVDGVLFSLDGASATLVAYPANKVGNTYTTPTSVSFAGESPTPVTAISYYAFQTSKNLTTLNISEGVTTIMSGIAESATLLSTINLPNSYTQMIGKPFSGASGITSLHIGKFLTSIDPGAFYQTGNLNSITVEDGNPNYSARDGVLFDNGQLNQLKLHTYPPKKNDPNYIVPDDVTHIESSAFDSSIVRTLSIPKSVSYMGLGAFVNTSALTSFTVAGDNSDFSAIDGVLFNKPPTKLIAYPQANIANSYAIPSGVEIIGESAFMSASNLTSVIIPSSVSTFENSAFFCASSLSKFFFLGNAPISFPLTCIGGEPSAYIKSGNATFALDADSKWNGLSVLEFDHLATYDSNGGSAVSTGGFTAGGTLSAPTVPIRDGYGFAGWSRTNGGAVVVFPYAPGGTSDITLFAKWDINVVDTPVVPPVDTPVVPPVDTPVVPPVDTPVTPPSGITSDAAAELAARTVGKKKSFVAKTLAKRVGIKTVSSKATVTISVAKSSKKICAVSKSKLTTLKVGKCIVTFTVQEPKPKKGKQPKAKKTIKTLVVQ